MSWIHTYCWKGYPCSLQMHLQGHTNTVHHYEGEEWKEQKRTGVETKKEEELRGICSVQNNWVYYYYFNNNN